MVSLKTNKMSSFKILFFNQENKRIKSCTKCLIIEGVIEYLSLRSVVSPPKAYGFVISFSGDLFIEIKSRILIIDLMQSIQPFRFKIGHYHNSRRIIMDILDMLCSLNYGNNRSKSYNYTPHHRIPSEPHRK